MSIKYTRKLFFNPATGEWTTEVIKQNDYPELPYISQRELDFDGNLEDIIADESSGSDQDIIDLLEAKYSDKKQSSRLLDDADRGSLGSITDILQGLMAKVRESRDFRDDFSNAALAAATSAGLSLNPPHNYVDSGTDYAKLFDLGSSSILPALLPYRDTSLSFRRNSFDQVNNMLLGAERLMSDLDKVYTSNRSNPLTVSIIPLSPPRGTDTTAMFPGDLFKTLVAGGAGSITRTSTQGINRVGLDPNIYKVVSTLAGQLSHQVSDGKSTINININVQLPPGYSQGGEDDET